MTFKMRTCFPLRPEDIKQITQFGDQSCRDQSDNKRHRQMLQKSLPLSLPLAWE